MLRYTLLLLVAPQVSVLREELTRRCRELENCRLESSRQLQEQQSLLEQSTGALNKELDALRTELQFKVRLDADGLSEPFGLVCRLWSYYGTVSTYAFGLSSVSYKWFYLTHRPVYTAFFRDLFLTLPIINVQVHHILTF